MSTKNTQYSGLTTQDKIKHFIISSFYYLINLMKNAFHAKTKFVDLTEGDTLTIWINEAQAAVFGISAMDKIAMQYDGQEYVLDANLTHRYVDRDEVGIPRDVSEKYNIPAGAKVTLSFTQTSSAALDALKRALK